MPKRSPEVTDLDAMIYRNFSVRADTFSEESRTVKAVISTESPVLMPDFDRMEMVPEILLATGVEFPSSRQVPFLDSHNRRSLRDQLGSAREIQVEDGQVVATLNFRKTAEATDALDGVRDGHITDVSVGYEVKKRVYVPRGETKKFGSREITGPANVATKWKLREVSGTPIGADDMAKMRGLDLASFNFRFGPSSEGKFAMNEQLRALLISRGMPKEHTDDEAQRWLLDNAGKLAEPVKERKENEVDVRTAPVLDSAAIQEMISAATRSIFAEQAATRAAFVAEVDAICDIADMSDAAADCRNLPDMGAVRKHIVELKAKRAADVPYGRAVLVGNGLDDLKRDIAGALTLNACSQAVNGDTRKLEKHLPVADRVKVDTFRYAGLYDLAAEFVRASGINPVGLTRTQVAQCAMFGPQAAGIRAGAYHNTGSFANLTLDAINKSMMIGYNEVPATWRGPMSQGQPASDFKNLHRIQIGAIPNLPVWQDTIRPELASLADSKESYAVECRSLGIDFGYKLIVNDDISAITRMPAKLGDASARTVNAVAWTQITSNPLMRDGRALFLATPAGLRFRKNLTTGAGNPTVTTLGALKSLMRLMRGENTPEGTESADILNLTPSYLVVPTALETIAEQLVLSVYDPSSGNMAYNTARSMTPVVEPLLDADSATAWYLFANPTRVETVEVTFLQGQETPVVRTVIDEHTLTTTYYILQSVAAKALDYRGVQKHAGA